MVTVTSQFAWRIIFDSRFKRKKSTEIFSRPCCFLRARRSLEISLVLSSIVGGSIWSLYFWCAGLNHAPLTRVSISWVTACLVAWRSPCIIDESSADTSVICTTKSLSTKDWQAWRYPLAWSSEEILLQSRQSTCPDLIITRHFPHAPSPPQGALICTPAPAASCNKFAPAGACTCTSAGRKRMVYKFTKNPRQKFVL